MGLTGFRLQRVAVLHSWLRLVDCFPPGRQRLLLHVSGMALASLAENASRYQLTSYISQRRPHRTLTMFRPTS